MPFVLDVDALHSRPLKKRKLTPSQDMARYPAQGYSDTTESPHKGTRDSEDCSGPPEEEYLEDKETIIRTSDREELIQCIKRGQRPTWVPKPGLEALCAEVNAEQHGSSSHVLQSGGKGRLLPLGGMDEPQDFPPTSATETLRRSLSALHTGDFREDSMQIPTKTATISTPPRRNLRPDYGTSPPSWSPGSPSLGNSLSPTDFPSEMLKRSRAPSLGSSLSSSFVMRIPTSPLVHATNNPSLDFSPKDVPRDTTGNAGRRRTMPLNAFESFHVSPIDGAVPTFSRHLPNSRSPRDQTTFPHRSRRSLSSFTYQPAPSFPIHSPAKFRRTSLASDVSPRQRASMVGSFEESILRGRMSTPPSKPLDFVAQIGVVGKGDCPASLRCPAHVTIPFPAVFYNYPSANESRSISDDHPSPYVGSIDLEHNLKPPEPPIRRTRRSSQAILDTDALVAEIISPENTAIGRALARESREKKDTKSPSSKVPIGGAYRVPQKGQLQIIIKNPNKTAVKLFLVPYDLDGMLPETKTFVRQRSFSSGPVLEAALTEKQGAPAFRDAATPSKDVLRYLIHLKFCSTGKGRFYLYDNIRIVFANRVPDDTEKLRNEVQLPEPRFSPYKPSTEGGSRSPIITEKKFSPGSHFAVSPDLGSLDNMLDSNVVPDRPMTHRAASHPFHLSARPMNQQHLDTGLCITRKEAQLGSESEQTMSPVPGFLPSRSSRTSPVPWPSSSGPSIMRGFSPATVEAGNGLISQKLRELNGQASGQSD